MIFLMSLFNLWRRAQRARRIYLDHAAATPTHPAVLKAMGPWLGAQWGNPSAIHAEGRRARAAVEAARARVATTLGIRPEGVVFTSSGTESNNLAILGYVRSLAARGRRCEDMTVLTTAIEHSSTLETMNELRRLGVMVEVLPVTHEGIVTAATLKAALTQGTVLVTLAYANSEVGTVQAVHALARTLRAFERSSPGTRIALHVDAAQAPLWLPCDLPRLDADLLSLDGGKCGGPKGSGVIAFRKDVEISPILFGGGQEGGKRPGTENVAAIVGIAEALSLAQASYEERARKVSRVRDAAIARLCAALPEAVLNGPMGEERLANNINLSLPGLDTEYAVVVLDTAGIAASTKSACAGAGGGESAVVLTLSGDAARSRSTLRLTLGEETSLTDFDRVGAVLQEFCIRQSGLTQ